MTDSKLAARVVQETAARAAQWLSVAAGVVAAHWHGPGAILLGAAGWFFFSLARPGPDPDLDRRTGSDRPP